MLILKSKYCVAGHWGAGGVDFWAESTETAKGSTFLANSRVLDGDTAAARLHNISRRDLAQIAKAHDHAWHMTAHARATGALGLGNVSWWASAWADLRAAVPRVAQLAPLSGLACAASASCIGVDPDQHCVCV